MTEPERPKKEPVKFRQLVPSLVVTAIVVPLAATGLAVFLFTGGVLAIVIGLLLLAGWGLAVASLYRRDRMLGLGTAYGSVVGLLIFGSCIGLLMGGF